MPPSDDVKADDRLDPAALSAIQDRLTSSDRLSRGAVVALSFESVRRRAGPDWERLRDQLRACVARKFSEHLASADLRQRLSETEFLVGFAAEEGLAAQAIALKIQEDVLTFFLGSTEAADLRIMAVRDLRPGGLVGEFMSAPAIALARAPAAILERHFREGVDPDDEAQRRAVELTVGAGTMLSVAYGFEPVINLRHGVVSALRIEPAIHHPASGRLIPARAFAKLRDHDIEALDSATLAFAALYADAAPAARRVPLLVPQFFRTVASRRGRNALAAVAGVRSSLIVEMTDVDRGTPEGRLMEVAAQVGAIAHGAYVRLAPARDAVVQATSARLAGLTLDAADLGAEDSAIAGRMLDIGPLTKDAAATVIVQGLPAEGFTNVAEVAGFTHAALRAPLDVAAERSAA